MIMRRVSRLTGAIAVILALFISTFLGLALTESRADAAPSQSAHESNYIVFNHPSAAPTAAQVPQMPLVLEVARPVIAPTGRAFEDEGNKKGWQIGSWTVPGTGTAADIGEKVGGAADCLSNVPDCVANMAADFIGGVVSWGAGGVINLVAGVKQECRGSGAGSAACSERIEQEYFPTDDEKHDSFFVSKATLTGDAWNREYGKFLMIAIVLLVPMIIAGALQAVISGKPVVMLRSAFLHLPAAIFAMVVTPFIARSMMAIVDAFSAVILEDTQADLQAMFSNKTLLLATGAAAITSLLPLLIVSLVFAFACLLIWFILSMREASIALLVAFIPVAYAASVWPALGKWSLRGIKLVTAAIISKIFIAGAISIGIGVISNSHTSVGLGETPSAATSPGLSFSHLIYGATIFFIAAFSPHLVMKFFDEIGEALNAAGGTGAVARGLSVAGNVNGTRTLLAGQGGGAGGSLDSGNSAIRNGLSKARSMPGSGGGGGGGGGGTGGPPANMAAVADAAAEGSRQTRNSKGSHDVQAATGAVGEKGGSGFDQMEGGTNAARVRAESEIPAGTPDRANAVAQRAGVHMGQAAVNEGLNEDASRSLAEATTRDLGGNAAAISSAGNSAAKAARKAGKREAKAAQGSRLHRFAKNTSPIHRMMSHNDY